MKARPKGQNKARVFSGRQPVGNVRRSKKERGRRVISLDEAKVTVVQAIISLMFPTNREKDIKLKKVKEDQSNTWKVFHRNKAVSLQ